ncbi:glycogenin-1-like isoform X1 [Acanthaster planci]|uniref:glycogenin glucosyltransferase n=1 Tax=Acanthaster planci TaxID=133434 RepID=A0A8B7YUS5_ACAPL|nr:glycogenin-1-like isoform X1 [Acanthaster planci]
MATLRNKVEDEAFVTLTTNDSYGYGALVLGQSLRDVGTTRQLVVMVTKQVSQPMRRQLSFIYDVIQQVDPFDSQDAAHLAMLTRPELGITFTKIHCWTLTHFKKCVFLDADCLVLQNVDDLFDREEFSAAPDVGWPDIFNSGVFVFCPSEETYQGLLQCAVTQGSFDGGDQGLLNTYFSNWATLDIKYHLPFVYNMTSAISYTYRPALERFGKEIRIVHFIGTAKPWLYVYYPSTNWLAPPESGDSGHDIEYVRKWWDIFLTKIRPNIEEEQGIDLSGKFGKLRLEVSPLGSPTGEGSSSEASRQQDWEKGQIDYLGKDSFDNIAKHMAEVEKTGAKPKVPKK